MRQALTKENRPKKDDVVMLCTKTGRIMCGVVHYGDPKWGQEGYIGVAMFVNDRETDMTVLEEQIRWWDVLPLTKKELWGDGGQL